MIAFAEYFEMPQNRRMLFSVSFLFENWSRVNLLKILFFPSSENGTIQKILQMLYHEKIIFRIFFGLFHDTSPV